MTKYIIDFIVENRILCESENYSLQISVLIFKVDLNLKHDCETGAWSLIGKSESDRCLTPSQPIQSHFLAIMCHKCNLLLSETTIKFQKKIFIVFLVAVFLFC